MNREAKIEKRKKRSIERASKNKARNYGRLIRVPNKGSGQDCPYDVDMNGSYGTCHCGGANYDDCLGDI